MNEFCLACGKPIHGSRYHLIYWHSAWIPSACSDECTRTEEYSRLRHMHAQHWVSGVYDGWVTSTQSKSV